VHAGLTNARDAASTRCSAGSPHFPVLWEQRRSVWNEVRDWLNKYNP
jgi:hypothetical protein